MSTTRQPRVAGQFYPGSKEELSAFLEMVLPSSQKREKVRAVIMPHAGYVYSGKTAALAINRVAVPDTVLLLGPNHTGYGAEFSLMAHGTWDMPLGKVPIDTVLSRRFLDACSLIEADESAHVDEHSLEVELPFLYFLNNDVKIVPITIGCHTLSKCREVGEAIAEVIKGNECLIVVSTDMTHYESKKSAESKDKKAIEAICALDEEKLAQVVKERDISMCGFLPVYILLIAVKRLGASKAKLIDYRTSGDAYGDYSRVVGYAGMIVP